MNKVIRPLSVNDLPELSKFFSRLTTLERGPKFVNWFYLIQTKSFLSQGAFVDDKLVGSISVVERSLSFGDGKSLKCGLSIHALIDPEFKDIVSIFELSKPLYKRCVDAGMSVIFGFPNKNYYFIQEKVDKFKEISKFNSWVLCSGNVIDSGKNDYHFEIVDDVYEISYLISKYSTSIKPYIHFSRSIDEYICRTVVNPESSYQYWKVVQDNVCAGVLVLKFYQKEGSVTLHVVDCFIEETSHLLPTLKSFLKHFKDKCQQFVFWPIETRFKELLKPCSFEEVGFETYFGCKNLTLNEHDFEKLKNINNWHLSMIDSDVF